MKEIKLSDYQKELIHVKDIPKIYLGQEVKTEIGKGIVVKIEMSFNGLYLSPEQAMCVVWFSTSSTKNGWVSKSFRISEVKPNYRKEKLNEISSKI